MSITPILCSQPTYEELKLFSRRFKYIDQSCSQPTYEELKPAMAAVGSWGIKGSQPTYEELKQGYRL